MLQDFTGDGSTNDTARTSFYLKTTAPFVYHGYTNGPAIVTSWGYYWYDSVFPVITRCLFTPDLFRPIYYLINSQVGSGVPVSSYDGVQPRTWDYDSTLDLESYPGRLVGTVAKILGFAGDPAPYSKQERNVHHTNLFGAVKGNQTLTATLPSPNTTLGFGTLTGVPAFSGPFNKALIKPVYDGGLSFETVYSPFVIGTRCYFEDALARFLAVGLFSPSGLTQTYVYNSSSTYYSRLYNMSFESVGDLGFKLSYYHDSGGRYLNNPVNRRYFFRTYKREFTFSYVFGPGAISSIPIGSNIDIDESMHFGLHIRQVGEKFGDWEGSTLWSKASQVAGYSSNEYYYGMSNPSALSWDGKLVHSRSSSSSNRRVERLLEGDGIPYGRLHRVSYEFQENLPELRPITFNSTSVAMSELMTVIGNNWIETLSELSDLGKLLPSVKSATNLLKTLSNGQIIESGVNAVDLLTDAQLYYSYGLAPNIDAAQEVVSKAGLVVERIQQLGSMSGRGSVSTLPYHLGGYPESSTLVSTKVFAKPSNETIVSALCSSWAAGLFPRLSSMWDLVPFSFVLDMFLDLSSKLERLDSFGVALVIKPEYYIHSFRHDCQIPNSVLEPFGLQAASESADDIPTIRVFRRELSGFYPTPRNSRFQPGLTPRPNWANLGSLFWKLI